MLSVSAWLTSAQHYLTHSLFNSPHVRFSVAQQQAILDWADEMGTPDLPTMYSIAKCQEELQNVMGDSSRMYTTDTGNVYYLNSIDAMVQQVCYYLIIVSNPTALMLIE